MDMSKEANEVVLCVSNAYQKKFYLNETSTDFHSPSVMS